MNEKDMKWSDFLDKETFNNIDTNDEIDIIELEVNLDYLKFNSFIDDDNKKYKLRTKGFETPYWLQDNHESEGANNI